MRILLIEDNQIVREAVLNALSSRNFTVDVSSDGEDGWLKGATEDYDCAILDLGLPRLDGLTILKRWRAENVAIPVLVLSARGRWFERAEGLNLGADDYLPKPFRIAELMARLDALTRRSRGSGADVHACQGVVIDLQNRKIRAEQEEIELGPLEWRLISILIQEKGSTVPTDRLIDHIYGINSDKSANALEALIKRLRRKLPVDLIRTRRGFGYMLAEHGNGAATDAGNPACPLKH